MASVYELKLKVVSEFCNYTEDELSEIILAIIDTRNDTKVVKQNCRELRIPDIKCKKIK